MIDNCSNDRIKLKNEISKIKTYFLIIKIKNRKLNRKILNLKENDDFNIIKRC